MFCILTDFRLEKLLEGGRAECLDLDAVDGDSERGTRTSRDALKDGDGLTGDLGGAALNIVITTTSEESVTRGGLLQVLNADVDLLLNNAGVDTLVEQNTDGTGSDVPDNTSLSVVVLVGHTLVNLTGGLHVDDVSYVEGAQIGGQMGGTVLTGRDSESVAGARAITIRERHPTIHNTFTKQPSHSKGQTSLLHSHFESFSLHPLPIASFTSSQY